MAISSSATTVPLSLRALLRDLIDYAGLFPPAGLPLAEAFPNYLRYRTEPEAWMLNHFIIPLAQLDDLAAYASDVPGDAPVTLSVLGQGGDDAEALTQGFTATLQALDTLHAAHAGRFEARVVEVRLPPALADQNAAALPEAMDALLEALGQQLAAASLDALDLFLEIPLNRPTSFFDVVAQALTRFNSQAGLATGLRVGIKMRTGSTAPDEIPPAADVARALNACRRADVHFKATAGLHHPMHHYNEAFGGTMHGFFNVFGAATLTTAYSLSDDEVTQILQEEQAGVLSFTSEGLTWGDRRVPVSLIETVRARRAFSFGSCSFDDPRQDLRRLGLLS